MFAPPAFSGCVPRFLSNAIDDVLPVPLSVTVCGLSAASSAMLTEAVRLPTVVGAKVAEITQVAFTASVAAHVFVWPKSPGFAPPRLIPLIARGAVPTFLTVVLCAALVLPTDCEP